MSIEVNALSTLKLLNDITKRGWYITLVLERGDKELGVFGCSASIGDCNCPYSKYYDPKDHHGFSFVEDITLLPEVVDKPFIGLFEAAEILDRRCKEEELKFGDPRL